MDQLFLEMEQKYHEHITMLNEQYMGKVVELNNVYPAKARGRTAVIDHVIIKNGKPLFCCKVTRHNTDPSDRIFLNTPSWSRSYRPKEHFTVVN